MVSNTREHLKGEISLYGWPPVWLVWKCACVQCKIQCTKNEEHF